MGWCSGSEVWDSMFEAIMELYHHNRLLKVDTIELLTNLKDSLESLDWDCQEPTGYDWIDKEVFPEFGEDEDE